MKKKLSLIIPLLAIFCLISCGYALLSNNMIVDDNSTYESPATITDSIPNTTLTKIENTDITEKNTEDNTIETIKQKSSTQITANNTKETELNYTDEWINSPDGTGYESPGPKPDHYRIPEGYLAKLDHDVYDAIRNPTLMTPELYQKYLEINSQYEEFCKSMDNSIFVPNNNEQPETPTPNNNQEINNHDINEQVSNNNEQPETSTPNNNQEISYVISIDNLTCK